MAAQWYRAATSFGTYWILEPVGIIGYLLWNVLYLWLLIVIFLRNRTTTSHARARLQPQLT